MSIRIAISDPLPVFRHGLMAVLGDAGFDSEVPDDLETWIRNGQQQIIMMTLQSADDWALMGRLSGAGPGLSVIAVLDDADEAAYVRALTTGAAGAVPRQANPEGMRATLEAVLRGTSLVPIDVLRALVTEAKSPAAKPSAPSVREIEWLRRLAEGETVGQLAAHVGYSERAMFRLLRDLYQKMMVKGRTEALMQGRERGWL